VRSPLVIIPTYNECATIERVVAAVRHVVDSCEVLVVDDGSPDGTGELAETIAAGDPHVHVMRRAAKEGLGRAYVAGFHWGLARRYDTFVEMDADLSHDPERLPALLQALEQCDVSIGSRYVPGGGTANWNLLRRALSRGGNLYTRLVLGLGVHDATAGYRAYRREVLEALDLDRVRSSGYGFQIEMSYRAARAGFSIAEVPIIFVERAAGSSKMSKQIVFEALGAVLRWAICEGRVQPTPPHARSVNARSSQ